MSAFDTTVKLSADVFEILVEALISEGIGTEDLDNPSSQMYQLVKQAEMNEQLGLTNVYVSHNVLTYLSQTEAYRELVELK